MDNCNATHMYEIPGAIYNPSTKFNLIGISFLAAYFNDTNCSDGNAVDADGTTIKSSGCCLKLIWDHGKHIQNFTHGKPTLPKLVLYQGHGCYNAFCICARQCYNDAIAFAFLSAFSILPDGCEDAAVVSDTKDSDYEDSKPLPSYLVDDNAVEWYTPPPPIALESSPAPDASTPQMPLPTASPSSSDSFKLGMSLSFYDDGNAEVVVYEGVMPDGLTHTIRLKDGTRLNVHVAHLCWKLHANLSNIPKTPLDYCKEVGRGITEEEAEVLARPQILTPIQQELRAWHHCLYHLSFPKIFCLAKKGHLLSRLLDCKGKLPLCIAYQFGAANCLPWHCQGKTSGSICCPMHVALGDGVSPGLIPQMSGFLTSHCIWGCTKFCNHISDFVYVHLMCDFTVDETILAANAFEKVLAQAQRFVKHYHAYNDAFVHK
jgi:hypothetical protein